MSSHSHDEFATPIGDFICASLVPGYSCAKIQSNIDGDHDGCDTKCCITGALFPICSIAMLRTEVREARGIEGSAVGDWCCALFCPGATGIQTYVESEILVEELEDRE